MPQNRERGHVPVELEEHVEKGKGETLWQGMSVWTPLLEAGAKENNIDRMKKMTESGRSPITAPQKKISQADGAKAAKEIFDSYIAAGFNEVQAFELLKLVFTTK